MTIIRKWTWADFAVSLFVNGLIARAESKSEEIVEKIPGLIALARSVDEIPKIAEWIKRRPDTQL